MKGFDTPAPGSVPPIAYRRSKRSKQLSPRARSLIIALAMPTHPNAQLIETFYTAFKNSDAAAMGACYHPDVEFSDPVFPALRGNRARAMWALLGQRKADPNDRWFDHVEADDTRGRAHWEAKYKFPATGRPVHNRIDAEFEFKDGKIVKHTDRFDFWAWSRQAFGPTGVLLGWGPLKGPVRKKLAETLDAFIHEHPEFR